MALSRKNNVLFKNIDEKYTSCKCHNCFERMVNMRASSVVYKKTFEGKWEKGVKRDNRVHKVLHCRNSVGSAPNERCGTTWDATRDVKATPPRTFSCQKWINGERRPQAFCWAPKQKDRTSRGSLVVKPDVLSI